MTEAKPVKLGLTERQREYRDWIRSYIKKNDGQSPSLQQIGRAMGTSTTAARRIVNVIVDRGHLTICKGSHRSLAIPEA